MGSFPHSGIGARSGSRRRPTSRSGSSRLLAAGASRLRRLELDPNYTPALLGSGKVSLRAGRHPEALALARQVLAREPRNVEALLVAGLASSGMNARAQAATFFDQALTLQPQSELQKAIAKLAPDGVQSKR